MKYSLIIFLLSSFSSLYALASLKSLDDLLEYKTENNGLTISDGDYFKDNNGRLNFFLGEWIDHYTDKNLELDIKKTWILQIKASMCLLSISIFPNLVWSFFLSFYL